jgi:hypothetical protein
VEHELSGPEVDHVGTAVPPSFEAVASGAAAAPDMGPDRDIPGGALGEGLRHDPGEEVGEDEGALAELDIDGSLLDSIEEELADVERALALLDEGTYGQCEHCRAVIDDDVLARKPTARFCAEHLPLTLR